jgi:CRP/FNR family transcriptional regulator
MESPAGFMPESTFLNCQICTFKSPLFNFLTGEELTRINQTKKRVLYKAGETIVKQGAPLSHVISFTNGLAKVYIESRYRHNLILQFIKPTQFLGGPGIYADNINYFSVVAVENSAVCFIDMTIFKNIIRENCDFAEAFMQHLSRNGVFNYERFISLTQKNMPARVADGLLYLQKDIFNDRNNEITISRQDLAELTGMSKDSVIRTLKELSEDGILELTQGSIKVKDQNKLILVSERG